MAMPDFYGGREQTWIKHYILKNYLEGVAYRILHSGANEETAEFVYVDGFSGPWESRDDKFSDTSFNIAISLLQSVSRTLLSRGRNASVKCLFVEKDLQAFQKLQAATSGVKDLTVRALHGEFENVIPEVMRFIGRAFALVFIDPTGWTGYDFSKIGVLLTRQRGEVLVNFMFDHINRFIDHPDPIVQESIAPLFGGLGWQNKIRGDLPREEAITELFREGLRSAGQFQHVLSTTILKSTADRSHFHLVYGTRHPTGLEVFRNVEKKAMTEQKIVRENAKQKKRVSKSGQSELFKASELPPQPSEISARKCQFKMAREYTEQHLSSFQNVRFGILKNLLLERFSICTPEINQLLLKMQKEGVIIITGLKPPHRVPRPENVISLRAPFKD